MDLLLLMACSEGDDGKVVELLDAGADPNIKVGGWPWGRGRRGLWAMQLSSRLMRC